MRRFRFPLETLLSVRRHRQEACEMKVAEIERQRREVAEERARISGEVGEVYTRERSRPAAGPVDVGALSRLSQFVRILSARVHAADLHLGKIGQKKEAAVKQLVEANRSVRLLENLKEDRQEEWRHEVEREDQAFLDELGIGGFRRQRGGMVRKVVFIVLALALAGGGVYAYKQGLVSIEAWKSLLSARFKKEQVAQPAPAAEGKKPVESATHEAAAPVGDVVFDATTQVYYFTSELGKNLRVSAVLKQLEEERARLGEKEAALSRLEQDLLRREKDITAREEDVDKKWREALAALEQNKKIVVAQESAETRERREMIARLAKTIGSARPASGAELMLHVDKEILPDVLKQIQDAKLSKILEQLAVSSKSANAKQRLDEIMRIMGKVEEATGSAKPASPPKT